MPHQHVQHVQELSRLHVMFHWMLDTWQAALLLVSVVTSWSIWWLRNVFVTQKAMREFIVKNQKEHVLLKNDVHSIKENVSWIKGFMEKHDD